MSKNEKIGTQKLDEKARMRERISRASVTSEATVKKSDAGNIQTHNLLHSRSSEIMSDKSIALPSKFKREEDRQPSLCSYQFPKMHKKHWEQANMGAIRSG